MMMMQCTREGVEEEHASWRQRKRSNDGSTSLVSGAWWWLNESKSKEQGVEIEGTKREEPAELE